MKDACFLPEARVPLSRSPPCRLSHARRPPPSAQVRKGSSDAAAQLREQYADFDAVDNAIGPFVQNGPFCR